MEKTKLLNILPEIEVEDSGDMVFVEDGAGESLTLFRLEPVEDDKEKEKKESSLNFYDMGGHMQYYCAQQIFKNKSSIYLITFERLN